jgi:hypothetical protein
MSTAVDVSVLPTCHFGAIGFTLFCFRAQLQQCISDRGAEVAQSLQTRQPRNQGSIAGKLKRFSLLHSEQRQLGPPSLLPNGYRQLFPVPVR